MQRYRAGLGNYLNVLTAETAVLAQRRAGVDLAARALDTQVAWRARSAAASSRPTPPRAAAPRARAASLNTNEHSESEDTADGQRNQRPATLRRRRAAGARGASKRAAR